MEDYSEVTASLPGVVKSINEHLTNKEWTYALWAVSKLQEDAVKLEDWLKTHLGRCPDADG